jgi:hypothetical protein
MSKKTLWSISSLARETGRNFRTVAKALAGVKPDGKLAGKPAFLMANCIAALEQHERRTGYVRSKAAPERYDAELEAKIKAIEESTAAVEELLARLRRERSVDRRRRLIQAGEGRCVGALRRSLAATIGDDSSAFLRELFVRDQMDFVMSEILHLCQWSISPQEAQ